MAGPWDLTGQNIENTYQRVLQTPDGTNFYDGTGSAVTFTATAAAGGSNTQIQFNSASLLSGSSNFSFDYTTNNVLLTGSLLVTQSHISTVDYIDFTTIDGYPHNEGRLHWTSDTKTLQIDTDKNNFMIEVGHQNVVRVYNDTGVDIPLGKVVRISGSQGNQPTIVTSSWEDDSSSAATLGFTATLISGSGGNRHGYVVTNGLLRNVNTLVYPVGTQLYLSSSGDFTNTPPDAPLHEVRLGKVIVQNATTGIIYVDIMNGYELTELHDVKTTTYSNGDLLIQSGSLWINSKTLIGSYTLTGSLRVSGSITSSLLGNASSATITNNVNKFNAASGTYFPLITDGIGTGNLTYITSSFFLNTATNVLNTTATNAINALSAISASYAPSSPGGSNTNIQYNNSGVLAGDNGFVYSNSGSPNYFNVVKLVNGSPNPDPDTEATEAGLRLENNSGTGYTHTFTTVVDCSNYITTTIFSLDTGTKTYGATCNYTIVDPSTPTSIRTGQLFVSFDGDTYYLSDANNKGGSSADPALAIFVLDYNGSLGRVRLQNDSGVVLRVIMNATTFTIKT